MSVELLEGEGIETAGGHGYHILWRLAKDGLICIGPMSERQPTFVLLDDWAPPARRPRARARGVARRLWPGASPRAAGR